MSFASTRKKVDLTQGEVAAALGVDQSAVSKWETGENMPRAAMLVKIAGLFACNIDELLKPSDDHDS